MVRTPPALSDLRLRPNGTSAVRAACSIFWRHGERVSLLSLSASHCCSLSYLSGARIGLFFSISQFSYPTSVLSAFCCDLALIRLWLSFNLPRRPSFSLGP